MMVSRMNIHEFHVPDGIIKVTVIAANGVRITHSEDGSEPQTLTVPELPAFDGPVSVRKLDTSSRLEAPGIAVEIGHASVL